jgi:hypothetical protein
MRTTLGIWINIDYIALAHVRKCGDSWEIYILSEDPEDNDVRWPIQVFETREEAQEALDTLMNEINGYA